MMILPTPIVSWSKTKQNKHQNSKKLALNWWLKTYQILTNDDQMLILFLTYFIATVLMLTCNEILQKLLIYTLKYWV